MIFHGVAEMAWRLVKRLGDPTRAGPSRLTSFSLPLAIFSPLAKQADATVIVPICLPPSSRDKHNCSTGSQ